MGSQSAKYRYLADGLVQHASNPLDAASATGGTESTERRILSCVQAMQVLIPAETAQVARLEAIEHLVVYARTYAPEDVMAHLGDIVRDFLPESAKRAERREF